MNTVKTYDEMQHIAVDMVKQAQSIYKEAGWEEAEYDHIIPHNNSNWTEIREDLRCIGKEPLDLEYNSILESEDTPFLYVQLHEVGGFVIFPTRIFEILTNDADHEYSYDATNDWKEKLVIMVRASIHSDGYEGQTGELAPEGVCWYTAEV